METIKVNLATFEYQDKRFSYPILMMVALIVLILSIISMQSGMNNQAGIEEFERKIQRIEKENVKKQKIKEEKYQKLKIKEIESIKKGIGFVNELIISDIFPWDRLLNSIETNMPSGITLLSFDVTKDQKMITLKGNAQSMNEISIFLARLNDSNVYRNNVLINLSLEQENALQESIEAKGLVVKFEIESSIAKDELFTSEGI